MRCRSLGDHEQSVLVSKLQVGLGVRVVRGPVAIGAHPRHCASTRDANEHPAQKLEPCAWLMEADEGRGLESGARTAGVVPHVDGAAIAATHQRELSGARPPVGSAGSRERAPGAEAVQSGQARQERGVSEERQRGSKRGSKRGDG